MIDLVERERWRLDYLKAGHEFAPPDEPASVILAWAVSMSMIAEQFYENADDEYVDA